MHSFICCLVLINGAVLGLKALPAFSHHAPILNFIDVTVLLLLVSEIVLRMFVYKRSFFKHPWNTFDFIVVALSALGYFSNGAFLKSIRVLMFFRIVEFSNTMKMLATALVSSFRNIVGSFVMLFLIFYIFAVAAHTLYGENIKEFYGSLDTAFLSLFQLMVYDSFGEIFGPMIDQSYLSWIFVVLFVFLTSFSFVNLIAAVVINAVDDTAKKFDRMKAREHQEHVKEELGRIKEHVDKIAQNQK